MLLTDVDLDGRRADVRVDAGRVVEVGSLSRRPGEQAVDGAGGALLPGLHDHHLHLLALAAAETSVDVSAGLAALAGQPGEGWLRAVGWAQDGDRHALDAVQPARPVRVQHRSGALWVLNSAAVDALGLDGLDDPGVERDAAGRPTGRLWRADRLLGRLVPRQAPDLAGLGRRLARLGLTGLTDATPDLDAPTCALLRARLPQHLHLLGEPDGRAPVKVVLPDHDLPDLDALVGLLRGLRPRPVAVHCVTRVALVLLLTALDEVGRVPGDRVEHASVVPPALAGALPAVVTQPGFLAHRGDDYLAQVDPEDLPDLYRYASLLAAGVPVVPSSDAPHGPVDPWQVLAAARDRRAPSGAVLGPDERVAVRVALDGLLRPLDALDAPPRRVGPGAVADLVLLHAPLAAALDRPDAALVRATWVAGLPVGDEEAA